MMVNNCTVVVRSVGERTEELCVRLLNEQVPRENIHVIREKPFIKAVIQSFRLGIERNDDWTLTVDADVLVKKQAISEMLLRAQSYGSKLFVYQGYVLDYLFDDYREGGPHLYRTALLPLALEFVTKKNGQSLRPESDVYHEMAKLDYGFWVDSRVYGVHDFFQYRADIVRKGYVHATKHTKLVPRIMTSWLPDVGACDRKAALLGLLSGLIDEGRRASDHRYLSEEANRLLNLYAFKEKQKLCIEDARIEDIVDDILGSYGSKSNFQYGDQLVLKTKCVPNDHRLRHSRIDRLQERCFRPLVRKTARLLEKGGEGLRRWS